MSDSNAVTNNMGYCLSVTLFYILSLYLIPSSIRAKPRDDKLHIKFRMVAASTSTLVAVVAVYFLSSDTSTSSFFSINHVRRYLASLGLQLNVRVFCSSTITTIGIMLIFYLGPISTWVSYYVFISRNNLVHVDGGVEARKGILTVRDMIRNDVDILRKQYNDIVILRNFIIAPITEELVFRSLLVFFLYPCYCSSWSVIFVAPAWFSFAHVHHCYEKVRKGETLASALISSLVQASYTYIFGCIAALLFLRTGSIVSPIASHVICNFIGLPNVDFMNRRSSEYSALFRYRWILLFLHGFGLLAFACCILPATKHLVHNSMYWKHCS